MSQPAGKSAEKGEKAAARPGRPSRTPRSIRARVATAVAIAVAAMVLVSLAVAGRTALAFRNLERRQYAGLAAESKLRLDRLIERDRARMMEVGFNDVLYAYAAGAATDTASLSAFIGRFTLQFGDRFVGAYDLSGRRLLGWRAAGAEPLEQVAAANPFFRILDNREPAAGIVQQGSNLYWVAGAPILPANYTDQNQPIRGYLVVAQPFVPGMIAPALVERAGRLELMATAPGASPFVTRVDRASSADSSRITYTVADIFAQQTTLATATVSRAEFRGAEQRIQLIVLLGIVVLSALGWAGYRTARGWFVDPMEALARSLAPAQAGQTPGLVTPVSAAAEWMTVTGAVNRLISNARSGSERFERLTAAGRDGLFERDLGSGDWLVNGRFRTLAGLGESDRVSLATLQQRLDPAASEFLQWLGAPLPVPASASIETRLRRPDSGDWLPVELVAEVGTDANGVPARVVGRLAPIDDVRAAAESAAASAAARQEERREMGAFLGAIARTLPPAADGRGPGEYLGFIGAGLRGTLTAEPAPFDLYSLLQRLAASAADAEITIVPGVPERVTGDRRLLEAAVAALLPLSAGSRIGLRVDQPERHRPELLRFTVEERADEVDAARADRINRALTTGQADGELLVECRAAHHLAAALGGAAGLERDRALLRLWVSAVLPGAAIPGAAVEETAATPAWDEPTTFELDGDPTVPAEPATFKARPSRPEPAVELVADATVTINFDDPVAAAPPVGTAFRTRLLDGAADARDAVRAALGDVPGCLGEIRRALHAGASRAAVASAETITRLAQAIDATPLRTAAADLIDSLDNQYAESVTDQVTNLEGAWTAVEVALAEIESRLPPMPALPAPAVAPPAAEPAIDPATLSQLSASLGSGLGGQLLTLFLTEAPLRLEAVEQAARASDWQTVRATARDLKGMCALVGAGPLAASCERMAAVDGPTEWTALLALRSEWERVQHVLEGLMGARTVA